MLSLIDTGRFSLCVSVPLVLEYEAAAKKQSRATGLTSADIDAIVDYICLVAEKHKVYYLWRPLLKDPKDDMVLELAVASNADAIITYNKADFGGSENFGIKAITPKELLVQIGEMA
jgi:predicted nucleic acid-binding protein